MKTAVSIPDDVFRRAEHLAKKLKLNRSQLFSRALTEFVARHSPDEITDALNEICGEVENEERAFLDIATTRTFERNPW